MKYEVEGTHHDWDAEARVPIMTKRGSQEPLGHIAYMAKAPSALFWPNHPQVTERDWENEKLTIQDPVPPGDLGLYSATQRRGDPT